MGFYIVYYTYETASGEILQSSVRVHAWDRDDARKEARRCIPIASTITEVNFG